MGRQSPNIANMCVFLKTSWFLSVLLNGILHGLAAPQFDTLKIKQTPLSDILEPRIWGLKSFSLKNPRFPNLWTETILEPQSVRRDKRHVLPALQGFKPSWLHLNNWWGSEARFQACRDTAFEANRLPTASAHEFACYMSHRFLIFDANDWIENCVTRELSGTGMSMAEGTFSACGICQ